jgi:hypothetical protein
MLARARVAACLLIGICAIVTGAEPADIAKEIEKHVQAKLAEAKIPASPAADDAEFLRRVYLDITGRIPTYDQAVAFLDDKSEDKRTKLTDELLSRPEYGLHFATKWRDLMIDRSSDMNQVRGNYSWEFITWLAKQLNDDRGWNELVTEMLVAEGEAKTNPATTLILANRMNDFPRPEILIGSTGKLFLGIQIGCAQCHDHPYIDEWHQDDFWGLAAFFSQLRDHNMDGNGGSRAPVLKEGAIEDAERAKRYTSQLKRLALIPAEPGAKIAVPDGSAPGETLRMVNAKFLLGDEPDMAEEGPYRPQFAAWLTADDNPYFAKATVNRLWAHFFAVGLVNPIDDMSPINKPTHPELLELLAKELVASNFHLKHLIRSICNSPAYQRTSRPLPENAADTSLFSHHAVKPLSADQMVDALSIASGRTPPTGKNRDQSTAMFATKEADAPAAEFSHGIPQFLFQMNSGNTNQGPNYLGKISNGKSPEEAITGLFLSVLSRRPKSAELDKIKQFVADSGNPNQAYRDVYWVLVNSAEFMFAH